MSHSQDSQFSILDEIPRRAIHVCSDNDDSDNESDDSDFENLSFCSYKSDYDNNELHQLLNQFPGAIPVFLNVMRLRKKILISPSRVIDGFDNEGMCVLHKTLQYFLDNKYKDEEGVDVVELMLNKSNLDYRTYQEGVVLSLLKKYDSTIKPDSVKYLQWQILSREGEELIVRWEMSQQEGKRDNNLKEVKRFVASVHKVMHNENHLDDVIESIFASGSLQLLKYLMRLVDDMNIKLVTPIIINAVYWGLFTKPQNVEHFHKCLEHLLNVADKKELCKVDEVNGVTALYLADAFNDEFMIRKLLLSGAPITAQAIDMSFPIRNVNADILREFLDSLVTATPTKFLEDESVWKVINGNFDAEYKLSGFIFMNFSSFEFIHDKCDDPEFNDLELINFVSESPRLCRLIDHPILATMIEMHWRRFRKWICLDQISVLFMLLAFVVGAIKYVAQSWISHETCRNTDYVIAALATAFLIGELIKNYKITNIISFMFRYIYKRIFNISTKSRRIHNFPIYQTITSVLLKIPLLIVIIVYTISHCDHDIESCRQTLGFGSIVLSLNLTLLVAYFNQTVAHYVIMFLYVSYTGFKFILSMLLILFGFGLGLFMLVGNFKYETTEDSVEKSISVETSENYDTSSSSTTETPVLRYTSRDWSKLGLSLFRVLVMSTGELEVSSFIFHGVISYIVFGFFIFIIPIVFFNLLNGLAIEDISLIKNEAMFWYRRTQLMILNEFQHFYWKV